MSHGGGLLGCCQDMGICFHGLCCTCCLVSENQAMVRDEPCSCCWHGCLGLHYTYYMWPRMDIAKLAGAPTSHCSACLAVSCCYVCAACQDARALRSVKRVSSAPVPATGQQAPPSQYAPPPAPYAQYPPPQYMPPQGYAPPPQGYPAPPSGYAPPPQQPRKESSSSDSSSSS